MTAHDWPVSPWVAERQNTIRFAVQIAPVRNQRDPLRKFLKAGRLAESLGLDGVFIGDHPARTLDFAVALAALATQTRRVSIGTMVACVHYRNPVVLARVAADLDRLSSGRFVLGIGCGWDEREYRALGLAFPLLRERQAALAEAIAVVRGAWSRAPFSFRGRFFQADRVQVIPPPLQEPGPPLVLAGGGEKVTLRQVALYADACNLGIADFIGGVRTPADVRRKLEVLRGHCDAVGRPFDSILRSHHTGWLILAPDEDALRAKTARLVPEGLERRFSGPWRGFGVALTVEQAVSYYRDLADAGITYFVAELLDADDLETIELLARHVAPLAALAKK
ncbi:MAG: LLM class F420-dependent oxidoreductase [Dehalococcoidia bacterium]|nr:MAG: LLM class F420-dependent oxidoreductase [Dehalococcoidia bacterium]